MSGHVKVGGAWKTVAATSVKVGGAWKSVSDAWIKVGGVWKNWGTPPTYELISTQVLGGNASSVTFSSINTVNYKHLEIRYSALNTTNNSDLYIRFNGDTASNYTGHQMYGNSAGVFTGYTASATGAWAGAIGSVASIYAAGIIEIIDSFNTGKYKTIRNLAGSPSSSNIRLMSGAWNNTAAITSVTLLPSTNSFATGSRFSLYGIKG